ncbi:MAG: hypothetical protein KGL39_25440, partial [Patescibacteria group bacterium]|nr:hypothetical protein [Patescibacteria group bacterium]
MSVILDILEYAGVETHYHSNDPAEISICCPFCVTLGESEDHRFRLGVNIATGEAQCFNCHWRGRGIGYTGRQLAKAFGVAYRRSKREKKEETVSKPLVRTPGLPP